MHILVVEDDAEVRTVLGHMLEEAGSRVISGSNEKILFAEEHHLQMLGKPFSYSDLIAAIEKAIASGVHGQRES